MFSVWTIASLPTVTIIMEPQDIEDFKVYIQNRKNRHVRINESHNKVHREFVDGGIVDMLRQIDSKHFGGGPAENLDQGEDVPDQDLLNGFMDGYNNDEDAKWSRQIVLLVAITTILASSYTLYFYL